MTLLFEKHLEATSPAILKGSDTPFLDEDVADFAADLTAILTTFAERTR
jgi:hypothetical protein